MREGWGLKKKYRGLVWVILLSTFAFSSMSFAQELNNNPTKSGSMNSSSCERWSETGTNDVSNSPSNKCRKQFFEKYSDISEKNKFNYGQQYSLPIIRSLPAQRVIL